jgi:hypothetical protein
MRKLQLLDRIAEIPFRYGPAHFIASPTWALTEDEKASIRIIWPTRYQWPPGAKIIETIKDAFKRAGVLRELDARQLYEGVVTLTCICDGRSESIVFDCSDSENFINSEALAHAILYFKCQYRLSGYEDPRIVPGGYPVTGRYFYSYYLPFRRFGNANPRFDIVARFGFEFQKDIRGQAIELLSGCRELKFVGRGGKVRYSRFLREVASSRLALHLPGNGPFTHRVAEFLGLGTCMISLKFQTAMHVPLVAGVHYVEVAEDLSDLVDKVHYFITHGHERRRIATAGMAYFDQYLHADHVVAYYLRTIADRFRH